MPKIISATVVEGSLRKESHDILKQWQDRYFVLDSSTKRLVYYADSTKQQMKGEYELSDKSKVLEGVRSNHLVFTVVGWKVTRTAYPNQMGDQRSELFLAGTTEDNTRKWIELLNKAIKGQSFIVDDIIEESRTCNLFMLCCSEK